ncbi:MAG TPA: TetR/AcrR family transcriptional regulator [Solirubrobacteraceae bacterium]
MCAEHHTPSDEIKEYAHGRVPRAVRERQVLQLAEELFAERGYRGASMDELARRAGVTKPVIYDLAGSKEELYRRCVGRAADELAARVTEAVLAESDPAGRLRAGGAAFFRFVADRRRSWPVLFGEGAPPGSERELDRVRTRQTGLVAGLLTEAARELGGQPDEVMLGAIADALNGAYERLAHWWADHPEVEPETLADWVVALVFPGLEALARQSASQTSGR